MKTTKRARGSVLRYSLATLSVILLPIGLQSPAAATDERPFLEVSCKEYHALTGQRVCGVRKSVWIRRTRYMDLVRKREQQLCVAEAMLTHGIDACTAEDVSLTQQSRECAVALSKCEPFKIVESGLTTATVPVAMQYSPIDGSARPRP